MISTFEQEENIGDSSKRVDVDLRDLPTDLGLGPRILDYNPNIQDQIQRIYLEKGPCQPKGHEFPSRYFGGFSRRFVVSWFSEFEQWLEYSVVKYAAFCLDSYLFKPDGDKGGGDCLVAFKNALDNVKFSSLEIQKDTVSAVPNETISVIIRDLGDSLFDIMIDESRDISRKKQMAIVLHYVNKNGLVEHFLAIVVNIINALSKHCNICRDKQAYKVIEVLSSGELSSGKDLNQETNMQRANDTCWGSHYGTLMSITLMFSSIIDVLEIVAKDESNFEQRFHAKNILKLLQSLDFVFTQFLMKGIIGFTTELSQTLQRKDDIVNTMILVEARKQALQLMRDSGWETLLSKRRASNIPLWGREREFLSSRNRDGAGSDLEGEDGYGD
ncbi:uncharacterized protein LOC116108405 [Pistacia vera]|uniref:uncharacterized protein LOC116108405 n=1 Tax=Pistacia vera TaxID=55513 RepID=UPI001262EEDF|nr:uncharacterized protein LOC116108405 [Pistacia vera]